MLMVLRNTLAILAGCSLWLAPTDCSRYQDARRGRVARSHPMCWAKKKLVLVVTRKQKMAKSAETNNAEQRSAQEWAARWDVMGQSSDDGPTC